MKIIAILVAVGLLFLPPEGTAAGIAILLFVFTGGKGTS
jgi:flagellar biosynthesis protein FliP